MLYIYLYLIIIQSHLLSCTIKYFYILSKLTFYQMIFFYIIEYGLVTSTSFIILFYFLMFTIYFNLVSKITLNIDLKFYYY